jgi:hypothetical protein
MGHSTTYSSAVTIIMHVTPTLIWATKKADFRPAYDDSSAAASIHVTHTSC